ncbi:MAG: 30S ribosomal protein S9 [Terriglobia bacterium]
MGDPENENRTPEPEVAGEPAAEEPTGTGPEAREPGAVAEEAAVPAAPASEELGAEAPAEPAAAAGEGEVIPEPQPEPVEAPRVAGPGYGTGRRKTSVARVYLRPGSGQVRVNGRPLDEFFVSTLWREEARGPLVVAGVAEHYDADINVKGGGSSGQAGAVRQGLARALAASDPGLRPKMRQGGFLTRDSRMKERKKYGQKGARKRFQWTKR